MNNTIIYPSITYGTIHKQALRNLFMIILGIETSCDETAAAIVQAQTKSLRVLSHVVASQIKTHAKYGGVVPEVAARQHITAIIPTIQTTLKKASLRPVDLDAIAVTRGPGLITSLRVGVQTARALAYAWHTKLVGVNHMEGHIYANWLNHPAIAFPALSLTVSGGHTELILMAGHGTYKLIGRTRDDAAGEAFDKVAKILRVGYPGGPNIQRLAEKGDSTAYNFPRPMLTHNNFDFSFSGLKTSVLYLTKGKKIIGKKLNNITASFQQAVTDVLVAKTVAAAKQHKVKTVLLAGGVAANQPLREQLQQALNKEVPKTSFYTPPLELCTDNAVMIALAGYYRTRKKYFTDWRSLEADPNWELV